MNIEYYKAEEFSQRTQALNKIEFNRIIKEIKETDFSVLSYLDVLFYAEQLKKHDQKNEKKYTANFVRELYSKEKNNNSFDCINSFIDDETDDIFSFF